jgi:hypothetical protein
MLIWIWIGIGLLAIGGIGLIIWQSQRGSFIGSAAKESPSLRRTVFTLQLGDIVQFAGLDWVVEGQLMFRQGSYDWFEYMLQDGDRVAWLAVEEDDGLDLCWMETVTDLELKSDPPQNVTYQGVTYQKNESGVASMTRIGTTLNKRAERCHYFDYAAPNSDLRLAIEIWDGDVEVSVGRRIRPSALTLLPGDGRRVYED